MGASTKVLHCCTVETIGVRQLRQDASRWLARVRAGEVIIITDRGRPVAQLAPLSAAAGYEALLAAGDISPGSGRSPAAALASLDTDLPPDRGPSVSAALEVLRDDWR